MKQRAIALLMVSALLAATALAAGTPNFAGEYKNNNFLNGQAVFQMSLEQRGSKVAVWFSTGYKDGHGAGPEAAGPGKVTSRGIVEFKFKDGFNNAGTGTIERAGQGIIVSLRPTRVIDSRCLVFYRQNIRLQRAKKGK
jgi:hypothetical protein